MSDYAIEVRNVKKSFYLPKHKNNSLKSAITQAFKPKDKGGDHFNALNGVSFTVDKGDFFGVLGRNGSGKSTLLKIISEIYQPTAGNVRHKGKVVSFIELGVGFKAELSGRENVYLNGALLGFSKEEVAAMYDDIVAFAELEEFMDQKLKNYSSGMKVRLAFSVAIRAKADILILDEVLAVGDASFQKKCNDYFKTLKDDGKTVVLVTHSMGAVREYCNRAVVIDGGKVIFDGGADEAADEYLKLFSDADKNKDQPIDKQSGDVELEDILIRQNGNKIESVRFKEDFTLELKFSAESEHKNVTVGIHIFDQAGRDIIAISSKAFGNIDLKEGQSTMVFNIQNILKDGKYYVNFAVEEAETKELLIQKHRIAPFSVEGLSETKASKHSLVYPNVDMHYE